MNQAAQLRPRGGTPPQDHPRSSRQPDAETRADAAVRDQARALDATFKALARKVLVDDDPTTELPVRQFRVCATLFDGARSMKELSHELGVSQSAITQIADRLEAAGMVTRGAVGEDRRVRNLELTRRARQMLRDREQRRLERMMEILRLMSAEDREALLASMAALKEAAEDPAS
jgi:DNA-binding MarR family transcriptional regulator